MSAPVVVTMAALSLGLAVPVIAASSALAAQARAAGAADAAALAAADAALGWIEAEPCALAQKLTDRADVTLEVCDIQPDIGEFRVVVSVSTVLGKVEARARVTSLSDGMA